MSKQPKLQKYDVWICNTAIRTTYNATLARDDDLLKPVHAVEHLDTVWAFSKRQATSYAVRKNQITS